MLVQMQGITKRFPGVVANDSVDFDLRAGEVHALLGENGAGKSTLMSILTGLYRPDEGRVLIEGRPVHFGSPREAIAAGIGMVHQHFKLVAPFTVAENVILGQEGGLGLGLKQVEERIAAVSATYGLQVEPAAKVWQLSIGEQQRVEIVKTLYRGARILILDEPTAVLTPLEAEELFRTLRRMVERGHGVIIITHKLHEVMAVSDRCTVLRGGRRVGTVATKETTPEALARMMLGRDVALTREKLPVQRGPVRLAVQELRVRGEKGTPAVRGATLAVHGGEILGLAGVAGNGQRELAEAIAGLRPAEGGTVQVDGSLAFIPEDRLGMGLVPNLDLVENALLRAYRRPPVARGPFLSRQAMRETARQLMHQFGVKTAGLHTPVRLLSGGNQQKLLVGRELAEDPGVIVAAQPVRGLDVAATEAVHRLLLEARSAGKAILLISEDLDELLNLSDRIAVIHEGRIMGIVEARPEARTRIGLLMAGRAETEEGAAAC
ncbi:MAG: ABC transporter ATP-binding protein [Bacillota bacterium]